MIKKEDGLIILYQDNIDFSKYEFVPKLLKNSDNFGFQIAFLDNEYKMIDNRSLIFLISNIHKWNKDKAEDIVDDVYSKVYGSYIDNRYQVFDLKSCVEESLNNKSIKSK